jgi:hypothetical protein
MIIKRDHVSELFGTEVAFPSLSRIKVEYEVNGRL